MNNHCKLCKKRSGYYGYCFKCNDFMKYHKKHREKVQSPGNKKLYLEIKNINTIKDAEHTKY